MPLEVHSVSYHFISCLVSSYVTKWVRVSLQQDNSPDRNMSRQTCSTYRHSRSNQKRRKTARETYLRAYSTFLLGANSQYEMFSVVVIKKSRITRFTFRIETLAGHVSATEIKAMTRYHPDTSSRDIPEVGCLRRIVERCFAVEEKRARGGEQKVVGANPCCQQHENRGKLDSKESHGENVIWMSLFKGSKSFDVPLQKRLM